MVFVKKIGNLYICKLGFVMIPIITFILPLTSEIFDEVFKFSLLFIFCVLWFLLDFMTYTSVIVMLNSSVPASGLGRINGITTALNCFSRMVAPACVGVVFAFFIDSDLPFPLNYCFSFYLLCGFQIVGLYTSYKIIEDDEET